MRISRTTALGLGWLITLAAGGLSAALPGILRGTGTRAVYFELPATFGSWRLQQRLELADHELKMLGAEKYWRRQYQCQGTQQCLVATLAAGPAGRIAAHSPVICYASGDYQPISPPRTVQVQDVAGAFWIHSFRPRTAGQPTLTVAYAWHDGDCWRAPRSPRWQLAGNAQVCRLQVACHHPDWATGDAAAALADFLHHALADTGGDGDEAVTPDAPVAYPRALSPTASAGRSVPGSSRW